MSRGASERRTCRCPKWFPYALTVAAGLGAALMLPRPADAGETKSGVSPSVISLPSGPGSIEGLGDSFEPQLNSGAARYQVAVEVPPGRGGFTPEIVLQYNSGSPNGVLGLGWHLSIPFVQRQVEKGLPHYTLFPDGDGVDNDKDGVVDDYDEFDTVIYSNKEELVPVTDRFWRLENESEFIRFRRESDGWSATRRDGVMLEFGRTGRSRVANGKRVFRWHLDRMVDPNGNVIIFDYEKLDDSAQVYVKRIVYNETDETAMEVRFKHEPRPDVITDFRPRFELKTAYRCTETAVLVGGEVVRSYKLSYDAPSSWRPLSLLASITIVGRDGISSLPPTRFGYTGSDQATPMVQLLDEAPVIDLSDANVDLLDINSDGLPDIIDTKPQPHAYFLNEGADHAGRVQWTGAARMGNGVGLFLGADEVRLADLNGDGRTDLVNLLARTAHYFTSTEAATWQRETPIQGASFRFNDPTVKLQDVDHDKRIDVIQSAGRHLFAWINRGGGAWSGRYTWPHSDAQLQFERPTTRLADMNGDRLLDLVHVESRLLHYHPAMGFGEFGERVAFSNAPAHILDPARVTIVDVNGDGRGDVVQVGNPLVVWLNQGLEVGNHARAGLAPPFSIRAPLLNAFAAYREADVNGNGSRDILWNTRRRQLGFVDFSPGVQPNLLSSIDNGIGGRTRIRYSSSVSEMVGDAAAGRPWSQTIPFPVPVVSGMVVDDGLNSYRTKYAYRDGYYDAAEKEFRGFAEVTQADLGDETIPDLVTSHLFDTGSSVEALKGKLLMLETRDPDGKLFFRERRDWDTRDLAEGTTGDSRQVAYAFRSVKHLDVYEGNFSPVSVKWDYEYDDFGNVTRTIEHGRLDPGWDDERVTETIYSASYPDGSDAWILDRVVQTSILDTSGNRVAAQRNYYDQNSTLGAISSGNPTLIKRWVAGTQWLEWERKDYDGVGNVTAIYDGEYQEPAAGHYRKIQFDPEFKTYPIREIVYTGNPDVPGLEIRASYDVGFGTISSHTDVNGQLTTYTYDAFGRLTSVVRPGDSIDAPTEAYEYVLGFDTGGGVRLNWVETRRREHANGGSVDSRQFFDGRGQKIMTREESEAPDRVVISEAVQFNARQLPLRRVLPYIEEGTLDFAPPIAPAALEYQYDALGRLVRLNHPDRSFNTIEYEPFVRLERDEEQTRIDSPHAGAARRFIQDGLQDAEGSGRLREIHEIVKVSDNGMVSDSPATWVTRYDYDLLDNVVQITDAQDNRKRMAFDGLGRKILDDDPNRGVTTYEYDAASNLLATVDAKQQRITYEYDGANRLTAEQDHDDGTSFLANRHPDVRYAYDHSAVETKLAEDTRALPQNTLGRLASVYDTSGESHVSYDDRGRVEWRMTGIRHPRTGTIQSHALTMEYDSLNRVTALVYPDGDRLEYAYNFRGLLERIDGGDGPLVANIDYHPSGQVVRIDYGNGVTTVSKYDERQRLSGLTAVNPGGMPLIAYRYHYDTASNIVGIDDHRPRDTLAGALQRVNDQAFEYDDVYRLTRVSYGFSAPETLTHISYRYDRIGNLLEQSSDIDHEERGRSVTNLGHFEYQGGRFGRVGRSPDDTPGPHAVTGTTNRRLTYDGNGNVTLLDDQYFMWDFKDRLVSVVSKAERTTAVYTYNYEDRRVSKQTLDKGDDPATGSMVLYIDSAYEVRDDTPVKYVYANDQRVASLTGSPAKSGVSQGEAPHPEMTIRYFHQDHIGSTDVLTDAGGNLIADFAYYPFGYSRHVYSSLPPKTEPYRFSQKEIDEETNLHYFEARYLNGPLARFFSVDPALQNPSKRQLEDPQRLNAYSYALNRPLVYQDPEGAFATQLAGGAVGVVSGYALARAMGTDYGWQDASLDFGTGAVGLGLANKLRKLSRVKKLTRLSNIGNRTRQTAVSLNKVARVYRTTGGRALPVPKGATRVPVINPGGKITGYAYKGGKLPGLTTKGGKPVGEVTMRVMKPTPSKGKIPAYPKGYVKYTNLENQGIDPFSGKTLSRAASHFPLD